MNRRHALLGTLGALSGALAACDHVALMFPRPRYVLARPGAVLELPCRIAPGGLILIRANVNGRGDAEFVLDTGAPVSVLIDGPQSAALALDSSGATRLGAADDPASPIGVIRPGFEIALPGLTLSGLSVVVMPQDRLACPERYAAIGFQGVIGADLMRRFVVEIDSAAGVVRLIEPEAWAPPPTAATLPLSFEAGHPFVSVDAQIGGRRIAAVRLHVDTGQTHDLSLKLGSRAEIHEGLAREPREVCFVSGKRQVWRGDAVQLMLGSLVARDVRPSYQAGDASPRATGRDGSLGIGLLGRYGLSIDYPGSRLALAPRA